LCSLQYGVMIGLEYAGILKPFYTESGPGVQTYETSFVVYNVIITTMACFLVAFLSSHLAQQTAKTEQELEAKRKDFQQLEAFRGYKITNLENLLLQCGSGKELIERGYKQDVLLAAELNVSTCAPILKDGAYIARGKG